MFQIMFNTISRRTAILIGLAILVIVATSCYVAFSRSPYTTKKAEIGQISADILASGTLSAHQSVVLTWRAGGVVDQVNVKIGQTVAKDTELATLRLASTDSLVLTGFSDLVHAQKNMDKLKDPTSAESQAWNDLVQAKHDVDDAQTQYDAMVNPRGGVGLNKYLQDDIDGAKKQLDNLLMIWDLFYEKLNDNNSKKLAFFIRITQARQNVSDQTARYNWFNGYTKPSLVDQGLAELNIAKGRLADAQRNYDKVTATHNSDAIRSAQVRLDAANATISRASISTPIAGTITDLQVLPGDKVSNGQYAVTVEDRSSMGLTLLISEVDIPNIQIGMEAEVTPHSTSGQTYKAIVSSVDLSGRITDGIMMYKVRVDLVEPGDSLMSGMSADVVIRVASYDQALLIPSEAIRFYEGERIVFVLRNNQPVPVSIRIGALTGSLAQVVGGNIKSGDEVVLNPPAVSQIEPSQVQ